MLAKVFSCVSNGDVPLDMSFHPTFSPTAFPFFRICSDFSPLAPVSLSMAGVDEAFWKGALIAPPPGCTLLVFIRDVSPSPSPSPSHSSLSPSSSPPLLLLNDGRCSGRRDNSGGASTDARSPDRGGENGGVDIGGLTEEPERVGVSDISRFDGSRFAKHTVDAWGGEEGGERRRD